MKRYTRGFTLIELLVVIAIIGILSSVVLVSLNSARKKGGDARVMSDVQQIRTQIETDSVGGNYDTSFTAANTLSASGNYLTLTTDASNNGGAISVIAPLVSGHYASYSISGRLPSQATPTYFCLDSTGGTKPNATASSSVLCSSN
jgi:prepilin-type N-terminal cleavage/methylation domain-containing protein